jgi:hypothetical protein
MCIYDQRGTVVIELTFECCEAGNEEDRGRSDVTFVFGINSGCYDEGTGKNKAKYREIVFYFEHQTIAVVQSHLVQE